MVPPGRLLDHVRDGPVVADVPARDQFISHDEPGQGILAHDLPHELDALHHGPQVFAGLIAALVEVAEVDLGHFTRVLRPQRHCPSSVFRVSLEDGPGEMVVSLLDSFRVVEEVALERAWQAEDEEVRVRQILARATDKGEDGTVGGVEASAVCLPLLQARIRRVAPLGWLETASLQDREIGLHFTDDADLVPVLETLADALARDQAGDALVRQVLLRPDAGEHQQLGRVEGATGQDDLPASPGEPHHGLLGLGMTRVGLIKVGALEEAYAGRCPVIAPLLQFDPGGQGVGADRQLIADLGPRLKQKFAWAISAPVPCRQRHAEDPFAPALADFPVVGVQVPEQQRLHGFERRARVPEEGFGYRCLVAEDSLQDCQRVT